MRHSIPILLAALIVSGCQQAETRSPADTGSSEPRVAEVAWSDLVPNPRQPLDGVVSGGQPTAGQLAQAAAAGYRTVVNLRMPGERGSDDEAAQVARLGMEYVALPIDGAAGITEENARELAALLESSERPLLLHCGSGNRVGALFALSAYHVDGLDAEASIQYGLDNGMTSLEPAVRDYLAAAARE